MEKPEVDSAEGLSPAISIGPKTTSHGPRFTACDFWIQRKLPFL
jgi:excinuclease UvrABC ATPase subunit